ncbi:MAG: hydroxymethylglutaryl-CoA reductase, degradative [Aerococcaceae bacterium]|nr:hydroxymethylglutaryl-CoA reductase, degradative [Aerococcaceae bacterium]
MTPFNQFYRKSQAERLAVVQDYLSMNQTPHLTDEIANQMIENYIYNYELPLGVATNFCINGKQYVVPMATEEPSVIAAASNGAKRLGNITAVTAKRELIGQIVLLASGKQREVVDALAESHDDLLQVARETIPNMVKRGGGPTRLWTQVHEEFVTLYLALNPCDAMGANVMNTVLETLSPQVQTITGCDAILNILSNYTTEAITTATVSIPLDKIGHETAQRIALASRYAQLDVYRAATHNKGIMNGIDAVVVATGNDWRAVEASVHAYASRNGQHKGLAQWHIDEMNQTLEGELSLPLPIATVGGTLSVHPTAKQSLALLQCESATELANILAAVGLAQNFAALRALVTDGIQKGHMSLQARSLALQVGATIDEVPQLVAKLKQQPRMDSQIARELLAELRK